MAEIEGHGSDPKADVSELEARRLRIRELLRSDEVTGPRDLAARLEAAGATVAPTELRADLRSLGVTRVEGSHGARLAVPIEGPAAHSGGDRPAGRPAAPTPLSYLTGDPDWPLQLVVVALVTAFVLAGLIAWVIAA